MSYPSIIKEAALEKLFHTDLSLRHIADELGIPRATLHGWKKQKPTQTADDSGDPDLIYSGRNCNLNEETLLRDAASIVLQTDDAVVLSVDEGEDPQPKWCEVRASLGSYYGTFYELTTDGKLHNRDTDAADRIGYLESLIGQISDLVDDMIGVEGEIDSYDCSGS
jgi:hypothetical protein